MGPINKTNEEWIPIYNRRFPHVFRVLFFREFEKRNNLAAKLASSNICRYIPLSQMSDNSSIGNLVNLTGYESGALS